MYSNSYWCEPGNPRGVEARFIAAPVGASGPRDSARSSASRVVYRGTRGGRVTPGRPRRREAQVALLQSCKKIAARRALAVILASLRYR